MDSLKIIPQIFFDLIGRIIPGTLAIFLFVILPENSLLEHFTARLSPLLGNQEDSMSLTFLFLLAYIIGHLISPLTKLIQKFPKEVEIEGFDSKKYEWLRLHQTEVGMHCAKLRAEFTMYNTFSAIFLLFLISELIKGFFLQYNHFGIAAVLFLLSFLMYKRGKEGEGTFQKNVINFYEAAGKPNV